MTINSFDEQNLTLIKADIDAAMKAIEAKHGIMLKLGGISFNTTSFNAKINAVLVNESTPENVHPKWVADFLRHAKSLNMKPDDLGKPFAYKGRNFEIVGMRPRARFSLVIRDIATKDMKAVAPGAIRDFL